MSDRIQKYDFFLIVISPLQFYANVLTEIYKNYYRTNLDSMQVESQNYPYENVIYKYIIYPILKQHFKSDKSNCL